MTTALTYEDLQQLLNSSWGSENFYRHPIARTMIYTDGIKDFAMKAGCYWLVDTVASYMQQIATENRRKGDWFNLVRVSVKDDKSASFSIKHDKGENAYIRQQIPYTDLPKGSYELYLIGDGQYHTLLCKSEY